MIHVLSESSLYVPVGQVERHSKWYLNVPLKQRQTVESLLFSYPFWLQLRIPSHLFFVIGMSYYHPKYWFTLCYYISYNSHTRSTRMSIVKRISSFHLLLYYMFPSYVCQHLSPPPSTHPIPLDVLFVLIPELF